MLDVSVAYNRYKFVGHEFLTWLWFIIETEPSRLRKLDPELLNLQVGNRIVLENIAHDKVENITIKGDDAGLEEGRLALRKGAVVTELNMEYKSGDHLWRFTVKGESLNISGLKPPESGNVESKEDIEGAVLEKVYLYEKVITLLDKLYQVFIKIRLDNQWPQTIVPKIKNWIHSIK